MNIVDCNLYAALKRIRLNRSGPSDTIEDLRNTAELGINFAENQPIANKRQRSRGQPANLSSN